MTTQSAIAGDVGIGIAVMEEGDDRQRGGWSLYAETPWFFAQGFFFKRSFGPITEDTALVAPSQQVGIPMLRELSLVFGGAALRERTQIDYKAQKDQSFNTVETRYNFGLWTGLRYLFRTSRKLTITGSWETALFPAGIVPGLFLATGRKQLITLAIGKEI